MADRLELEARFNDKASAGVKKLGKTLEGVKPTNGMEATNAWARNFRKEADAAFKTIRPLQSGLRGLGVGGLAAGFSLGEIVRQMRELADSTATMKELGRQSGMATIEIQRLQYVAGKLHVDPEKVSGAIDQWSGKMVEFRRHTGQLYVEMMRQNGDVARKIAAEDPAQGFRDTLDFLSRIPAAAMKAGATAADAAQIQKRWADVAGVGDLVPTLAKGPEGLRDAFAEAGREVKPITKELEAQAEALNQSLNRMDQSFKNFKNDFGPTVIGGITGAVDQLKSTLDAVDTAYTRYSKHPESIVTDAADAIDAQAAKNKANPSGIILDVPGLASSVIHAIKGDGPKVHRGEDGNALRRGDNDLSPVYRAALAELARSTSGVDGSPTLRRSASDKWVHPDDDRLSRARSGDVEKEVREGSRAGIIQGLRELAQQQELDGKAGGGGLGAGDPIKGGASGRGGGQMHSMSESIRYNRQHTRGGSGGGDSGPVTPFKLDGSQSKQLGDGIRLASQHLGIDPKDLATAISYETGGTMDPWKPGPHTKWGWHHGLIQWGEPQAKQYGVSGRSTIGEQMAAVEHYLRDAGVKPGMGMVDIYSAINAGRVGKPGASDRPGMTVASHVQGMLHSAHRTALDRLDRKAGAAGANPPSAGTPAPSAAAVTDAERFAAQQRIINGSRDPKDRALIDRYLKEQNSPKASVPGHRAGGWIRGPGGPTADRVPAMLSNGEFVVNARASGQWAHLLHAINSGNVGHFADGGEVTAGLARHRSWRSFFRRPMAQGGMGAPDHVALGAMAMMMGESGKWMNPAVFNPNDVDGPSGGSAQWHDVVRGPWARKIHRWSDLARMGFLQHEDWRNIQLQQANFKREATGPMAYAWNAMRRARTAAGALDAGVRKYEVPAHPDLEVRRRMPNVMQLQREAMAGGAPAARQEMDPLEVTIRHHPHTGHPIVTARAGKGVKLNIRSAPTMRPT